MSFKTGTATNYFDLLTILKDFLTVQGHGWNLTQTGTGNGRLNSLIGKTGTVVQTITCTASSSSNFNISGSVTGSMGAATVGTPFTHAQCDFTIAAGGTAFVSGDTFVFNLSPKWSLIRFGGCGSTALRTLTAGAGSSVGLFNNTVFEADQLITTSGALPVDIGVQMQVATEVRAFSLWSGSTNTDVPTSFQLDWSNNGSSWTTAQSWTGQTWSASQQRKDYVTSSAPGAHIWWRIRITAGSATILLSEARMWADTTMKWACSNTFEWGFQGPGVDNAQQIFCMGYTNIDIGTGYYNWVFRGVRFWSDQQLAVADVPISSRDHAHLLTNTSIPYWIVAHGSRFILLTRISGVYEMSYIGYGLPYETPSNHPYPYIIGTPTQVINRFPSYSGSSGYRNPCDPSQDSGGCTMEIVLPTGSWYDVGNSGDSGPPDGGQASDTVGKVWPYAQSSVGLAQDYGREAVDGTLPCLPLVIVCEGGVNIHPWGEFDGVYYTTGFGNSAAALTRIGAVDFINWPNVYRSGNNHFAMVALD
jgi:hypothetical protein